MEIPRVIHGRLITTAEVAEVRQLIADHPEWTRTQLSMEVCARWQWRNAKGQLRDIACRTVLLRLHRAGILVLPPGRNSSYNERRHRRITDVPHEIAPLAGTLADHTPLSLIIPRPGSPEDRLFVALVQRYHYLGFKPVPGENLRYLALAAHGRPVACLLFAAAAWKVAARDRFIGWSPTTRAARLRLLANNTRFLIPPWVRVPHLASHVLSRVRRRIAADWQEKYGHRLCLLETFVDTSRFRGTCYRAAHWQYLGQTTGRTRNDRYSRLQTSIKDLYVYPLHPLFRQELTS